jgi:UDP-GlcNAc3NAcA epimerase
MKICTIVGARPQFIKAAPVSRAVASNGYREVLIHTGQHYDYNMSDAFFEELQIREPDYHLGVGCGTHGAQTGQMLIKIEQVLLAEEPDLTLVYGDTNSTLAGSLAASKLHIPTAHIEAGERSFDRRMPEEINRLVADCVADLHFCASKAAVQRLADEGIVDSVHWVGDVMLDALLQNRPAARLRSGVLTRLGLEPSAYALVTVHRAANTDDPGRLQQIVQALNGVSETIVFPAHPRTRKALAHIGAHLEDHVRLIDPVGYFDMMVLEENARLIATDSGGVQREAYFLGIPCLTLREETEWIETVQAGWNRLVGTDPERVIDAWSSSAPPSTHPPIFGDGTAGERIVHILENEDITFGLLRRQKASVTSFLSLRVGVNV